MQSPSNKIYDVLLSKILRQTAKFSDVDQSTTFQPKLVNFLTHVGRLERKLKSTSKKTLANQIVFQVNTWLEAAKSAASDSNPKLSAQSCWTAVLYLSLVLNCNVESVDDVLILLNKR